MLKTVRSDLQHRNCRGGDVLLCKSTVALTIAGADYSRLGNLQRKLIELMSSKRRKMSCFLQVRCVSFFAEYGELPRDIDEATSKVRFARKLPRLCSLSLLGQSLG